MRKLGFLPGALFGIALVATCTSGSGGPGDGGGGGMDIGVGDARADSMSMTGTCDKERTLGGGYSVWYADINVPGLDPTTAPHLSVILCDPICVPSAQNVCPSTDCPMGRTCGGYAPPALPCTMQLPQQDAVTLTNGRVVVMCGNTGLAVRYQHAYLRLN